EHLSRARWPVELRVVSSSATPAVREHQLRRNFVLGGLDWLGRSAWLLPIRGSVSSDAAVLDREDLRMIDPNHVPPVADEELLARFIVNGNEMRADGTVRPLLFLPYKRVNLSVNRHRQATLEETW